jgi:hypothetical protein
VRVRLTTTGHDLLYHNRAQRDRWLADAVNHVLTPAERKKLGDLGDLLDRIAAYSRELNGRLASGRRSSADDIDGPHDPSRKSVTWRQSA